MRDRRSRSITPGDVVFYTVHRWDDVLGSFVPEHRAGTVVSRKGRDIKLTTEHDGGKTMTLPTRLLTRASE